MWPVICWCCVVRGGWADPRRVAGLMERQNGVCYWCHLGVRGGSDNSWQMSGPSPPPSQTGQALCCNKSPSAASVSRRSETYAPSPMPHQILPFKADISQLWRTWMGRLCLCFDKSDPACGVHQPADLVITYLCWSGVCKLDGRCWAADSDWNSTEVWVVHRPLVWALILYTQGRSGPLLVFNSSCNPATRKTNMHSPKTHNNQPELEISSHSAVLSAVWPSHCAASGHCDFSFQAFFF